MMITSSNHLRCAAWPPHSASKLPSRRLFSSPNPRFKQERKNRLFDVAIATCQFFSTAPWSQAGWAWPAKQSENLTYSMEISRNGLQATCLASITSTGENIRMCIAYCVESYNDKIALSNPDFYAPRIISWFILPYSGDLPPEQGHNIHPPEQNHNIETEWQISPISYSHQEYSEKEVLARSSALLPGHGS